MKGDEMETKKIGGSVNLMVSHPGFLCFRKPHFLSFLIHFYFPTQRWSFFATETQNFYKSEVNKEDMYIRYIHKLCDLHLQAEDFTGNARRRLFSSHLQCACVTPAFIYSGQERKTGRASAAQGNLRTAAQTSQRRSVVPGQTSQPGEKSLRRNNQNLCSVSPAGLKGRDWLILLHRAARFFALVIYFLLLKKVTFVFKTLGGEDAACE